MTIEQYFDDFCNETFWDSELSWRTNDPKLSKCFRQTALVILPCLMLWIFSPVEAIRLARSKTPPLPWTFLNISRLLLTLFCAFLNLVELGFVVKEYLYTNSDFFAALFKVASYLLMALFLIYHRKRGYVTSGIVWMFVFLSFGLSVPILYNTFAYQNSFLQHELVIYWIYSPSLLILLILISIADKPSGYSKAKTDDVITEEKKPCPQDRSSFPSRFTFWWFTGLAYQGWKQDLKFSDLWALRTNGSTRAVTAKLHELCGSRARSLSGSVAYEKSNVNIAGEKKSLKQRSVFPTIAKTFGLTFLTGAFCKLFHDILAFTNPQLLKWLIQFIESEDEPFWHGLVIVFLMFSVSLLQSIVLGSYFHRMMVIGLRIRSGLTATIYRKSLQLSNAARKESTIGEIVNLMSVDAQRFTDLMQFINLLWSAPLQIIISIYFLWLELGPSVLAGVAVMVFMIPMNAVVAGLSKKMQVRQMKQKDERVKSMNEVLNGVKVIKLYAWEESFMDQILGLRNKEVRELKNMAYLGSISIFLWTCAPFLVALVSFAIFVLSDESNILDAQKAFVSLTLFNMLRFPLTMLPNMITMMVMTLVSVKRLNKYLNAPELDKYVTNNQEIDAVTIENGTFAWDSPEEDKPVEELDSKATLRNINLQVPEGSFVAIVGNVGSGKSSVLSALLGEMELITGRVNVSGNKSIAYVPQQAWIQNVSLKDNILFGNNFDARKYNRVINNCALKPDIDILPGGDDTEIGEKGINLSGGQKQRVNLARACYSDSDIYLFDDPLSAVDSHVAKHLFDKVLSSKTGMLKEKTRILVTNSISLLPLVDQIIVLKNGSISESGHYVSLIDKNGDFAEFVRTFSSQKDEPDSPKTPQLERQVSVKDERSISVEQTQDTNNTKLIETEKTETGEVKLAVYGEYFKAISAMWGFFIILGFVGMQVSSAGANVWLSEWSTDQPVNVSGVLVQDVDKRNNRLIVYGVLGTLQAILVCVGSFALAKGTLDAAVTLHKNLLYKILRSPMMFFDTTPLGRIVNRFSKDIDVVDTTIPGTIRGWLTCFLQVVTTIIMIGVATPWFLLVIIPILFVYFFVQKFYVPTSRQLKRLESITRSPIFSHFSETLAGVSTIRAYAATDRFVGESDNRVDQNIMCCYPSMISNRWLAIRLEFCGNCIIMFSALFAVFARDTIDAGLAGLSVSYALGVTQTLNWLIRMTSDLETNIVSVERIMEYSNNKTEAEWVDKANPPPQEWPDKGAVEFSDYAARYRPGLELIIKNITTVINPQEKIGIVGRTGAGKSTITLSLFRIIEAAQGKITIDGVDISTLGLHDVRSRITIIPQDPILFSGTLRFNLDPFNVKTDDQLWKSLEHAHLKNFVKDLDSGLEHKVSEGGENLSVGQRQLICLARALLRKTKILLLDEATAAVDLETDSLIQSTIRTEFADCTILTIAHRLNTILDSTRVMVLDKGEIKEFDSPAVLLKNKSSIFYSLAKDAGVV